jgi:hypothetical protein
LLFPGAQKGKDCLQPMVLMAEQLLALPPARQSRLLWRLDAGFGTDAGINWLLPRHCRLLVKGFNNRRAQKVVGQVPDADWIEVGPRKWAARVPNPVRYACRIETLALDWFTGTGKEKCALLIHQLFDQSPAEIVRLYNARGGMETEIRDDKVGLQLAKRRKHAWPAQAAWVVLTDVAHNLLNGRAIGCGTAQTLKAMARCASFRTCSPFQGACTLVAVRGIAWKRWLCSVPTHMHEKCSRACNVCSANCSHRPIMAQNSAYRFRKRCAEFWAKSR